MPSQEDYLDNLTGGISEEPDLDILSDMSEEQIDSLLAGKDTGDLLSAGDPEGDVLELDGSGDSDLQEIQEMLHKSDRNEAVDSRKDSREEEDPATSLMADIQKAGEAEAEENTFNERDRKKREKERLKAEKKAAREAAKAEKKAKRSAKKGGTNRAQQAEQEERRKSGGGIQEYDIVADKAVLDSIVSEANKAEHESESGVDLMEVAAQLEAERKGNANQEIPYTDDDESDIAASNDGILALDMDEVDSYIPELGGAKDEKKAKKKGKLSKLMDFLTEEEPENEDLPISDENQEVIRELDSEEAAKVKKKVKKKAQKKEKKDAKKNAKPKKAPKPPKPKKEKKPKAPDPYPGRKLGAKKVTPVVLLGASVGAVLFILINVFSDFSNRQTARAAFQEENYETCYLNLYGKRRNETEEQMYSKSECILRIRMWYREYEMLVEEGSELKALDSLIQSVKDYPALYTYAFQWEAETEVDAVYTDILNVLSEKYGISESRARQIAEIKGDIDYTRAVMAVAEEAGYWEAPRQEGAAGEPEESVVAGSVEQPDMLPEETELEEAEFAENP